MLVSNIGTPKEMNVILVLCCRWNNDKKKACVGFIQRLLCMCVLLYIRVLYTCVQAQCTCMHIYVGVKGQPLQSFLKSHPPGVFEGLFVEPAK